MKTRTAAAVAALVALLGSPAAIDSPLAQVSAVPEDARVIVKYRAESGMDRKHALTVVGKRRLQTEALGADVGVALVGGPEITERSHVVIARGMGGAALAAKLSSHPDVEFAVVDQKRRAFAVPNDPFYATRAYNSASAPTSGGPISGQWYLKPPSAGIPSAINAEAAWDLTTGSTSIVVAVLDTGARLDHPDLQGGKVVAGYDFVAEDSAGVFASANDGNGRDADPSDPGDWISDADRATTLFRNCTRAPSSWHGTQTMSIVGAQTNNGVGMAGTGWNVRVQPVRVLGKCGGYDSDILAGMRWAAGIAVPGVPANATPAKVVNLSLGGTSSCSAAYRDAVAEINAAGAVVIASAGNSAGRAVGSPANCAGVVAVAGLRHVGTKVGFSDIGPEVALAAPGGNCVNVTAGSPCLYAILTASNAGTTTPVAGGIYSDAFNASFGTSFSAPMVAGVAGLMLSRQSMSPAEVRATLVGTTRPFPTTGGEPGDPVCQAPGGSDQLQCYCTTSTCGAGMLDARAAVLAAGNVFARVAVATATPTAGQPVTLNSSSLVPGGQSITGYAWTVTDAGTTGATIVGAANGPTVTVQPTAAGTFTAQLVTTSSTGSTSTASTGVSVAAAPAPPSSSSDSGGGGALGLGWLLLLAVAVLALWRTGPRRPA